MSGDAKKVIAGIIAALIVSGIGAGVTAHADISSRVSVVEDRTEHLEPMRASISAIQRDMAAICQAIAINRQCGSPQ